MNKSEYAERVTELTNEALRSGVSLNEITWVATRLLRRVGEMKKQTDDHTRGHQRPDTSDHRIDEPLE